MNSNTLNLNKKGDVLYYTFPKIEKAGGVKHGFSTRLGGVSEGHCSSMNFGHSVGDDVSSVEENFRIFSNALGVNAENIVLSQQTHTNNIKVVTSADKGKGLWRERDYTDIDGLVTNEKGLVLVTQYADCTPLAFYDPIKKVVATSHAGWRGTVAEIAKETIKVMTETFGSCPKDIICGIGPNIGACCYEVDDPVINEINKLAYLDLAACYTKKDNGKYMLNLREVNRQIMVNCGINSENIDIADLCTCCNSDIFHSHRATKGKRGTLALMISLD